MESHPITSILLSCIAALAGPSSQARYLDPGSGSFILQLLLATLLGGLFLLKTYWQKVSGFFRSRFSRRRDDQEE